MADMETLGWIIAILIATRFIRPLLRLSQRSLLRRPLPKPFLLSDPFAIDGDTLARGDLRIRIWGIDAPENGQAQGRAARQHLISLISGKSLTVVPRDIDAYGRLVAQLHAGKTDIGAQMVADGYALANTDFTRAYAGLQRKSRRNKSGLWRYGAIQNPGHWRRQNA